MKHKFILLTLIGTLIFPLNNIAHTEPGQGADMKEMRGEPKSGNTVAAASPSTIIKTVILGTPLIWAGRVSAPSKTGDASIKAHERREQIDVEHEINEAIEKPDIERGEEIQEAIDRANIS